MTDGLLIVVACGSGSYSLSQPKPATP